MLMHTKKYISFPQRMPIHCIAKIFDQRLFYENIKLTIYGSMIDVFGAINGQNKPVLFINRDVERNLPMLKLDGIERRLGWAKNMLRDVIP